MMMKSLFVFLQEHRAIGMNMNFFIMMALLIVVFYFFMIRPQMKRQKELRKFQESLSKGDKVIIAGGVMGKVFDVKEDHIIVEIDDNVKVKVIKSSVLRDSSDLQQK